MSYSTTPQRYRRRRQRPTPNATQVQIPDADGRGCRPGAGESRRKEKRKKERRQAAGCGHRQSAPVKATVLIPLPLVKPLPRRRPPIKSTAISFLLSPIPVHQLAVAPATRAADQASARERRDEEEKPELCRA